MAERLRVLHSLLEPSSSRNAQVSHPTSSAAVDMTTTSNAGPLTTHILDTARGQPACGVPVSLFASQDGSWVALNRGRTNADGRLPGLLRQDQFRAGVYKLHFDTAAYFDTVPVKGFFPYVEIVFEIVDPSQHYHVPLLLSPFGYSTYRGS